MITNLIQADITAIFPEFKSEVAIDSKTGIAILEKYTVPEKVARLDPWKLLKFMQKNGRNPINHEDARRLIDLASKSIVKCLSEIEINGTFLYSFSCDFRYHFIYVFHVCFTSLLVFKEVSFFFS